MTKFFIVCVVVIAAIITALVWLGSFTMFEADEETLASHRVPGKDFTVDVRLIGLGATTADVIHVKKVQADGATEVLKVIEHSELISSELVGDSILRCVVPGRYEEKLDTVVVAIERTAWE